MLGMRPAVAAPLGLQRGLLRCAGGSRHHSSVALLSGRSPRTLLSPPAPSFPSSSRRRIASLAEIDPDHPEPRNPSTVSIDPFSWEDTAFDQARRDKLGLRGLLPPGHQSLQTQIERTLVQLRSKKVSLDMRQLSFQIDRFLSSHLPCRRTLASMSSSRHSALPTSGSSTPSSCRMQR